MTANTVQKQSVLVVYGTRPEVIKLAPVVRQLQCSQEFHPVICATAQHRELLDQMTRVFDLTPDYDLNVMTERQTLFSITTRVLEGVGKVIETVKPAYVLVQGDTTTTFASSLAAFYHNVPVGHVEAGLRTFDVQNPYPEEMNRRLTSQIASIHFAPTQSARANLLREGVRDENILVTGNTVVDAIEWMIARLDESRNGDLRRYGLNGHDCWPVLITAHRRENWGDGLEQICMAIRNLVAWNDKVCILFPVHPNPVVSDLVKKHLNNLPRVHLIPALSYPDFVYLMSRCRVVITDSGGVQEEVASLGKPVVITREKTERPEIVSCGLGILTGTDPLRITKAVKQMLEKPPVQAVSPFGDGRAAKRIVEHLRRSSLTPSSGTKVRAIAGTLSPQ